MSNEEPRPDAFQVHLDLGVAYIEMDRFTDAVRELEIAQGLSPKNKTIVEQLSLARREAGIRAKLG